MIDRKYDPTIRAVASVVGPEVHPNWRKYRIDLPFTKSNGTIMARVYERLTRKSRRRANFVSFEREAAYRHGVYDTLAALQDDLSV